MTTADRRALLQAATAFALCGGGSSPVVADPSTRPDIGTLGPSLRRRRYVDARFGQVHVTTTTARETRGRMPVPVCCLPMSPRSGRDFDEFAAHLGDRRVVHCPDVPGFGGSDPPPEPPAIDDYAAALLEALDGLLPPGRRAQVDLVGQHTGAAMAVEMARQQPQRIRRLVLIGVPLFGDAEREELRQSFVEPRPYFQDPEFLSATWKRDLTAVKDGLSEDAMLMRFTEIMRAGPRSWWGFNAVFNYPMRERLPRIGQPVLTVALQERLGPATREAAALVQNGRYVEMPDLSGAALDFAAGRLAGATREFLDAPA